MRPRLVFLLMLMNIQVKPTYLCTAQTQPIFLFVNHKYLLHECRVYTLVLIIIIMMKAKLNRIRIVKQKNTILMCLYWHLYLIKYFHLLLHYQREFIPFHWSNSQDIEFRFMESMFMKMLSNSHFFLYFFS